MRRRNCILGKREKIRRKRCCSDLLVGFSSRPLGGDSHRFVFFSRLDIAAVPSQLPIRVAFYSFHRSPLFIRFSFVFSYQIQCRCFPERSSAVSDLLLSELLRELKLRPRPFLFESLSGGPNLCTYKSYQIVRGKSGTSKNLIQDEILLLRRCFSGHIYTSGHLDFSPDLASRFSLHPIIRKIPTSSNLISFLSKALRTVSFDSPIPLHWETLYHSIDLEAPYLIFSSNPTLPLVKKLKSLGGDVTHKERSTLSLNAEVAALLAKAIALYPQRVQYMDETMHDEISEMICDLQEAAVNSNRSLRSVGYSCGDSFLVGSASEMKEVCPLRMSGHSVLGQVLYGGCVPKNVEGWDVRVGSLRRRCRNGVLRARL